jgi:hypothetical protein
VKQHAEGVRGVCLGGGKQLQKQGAVEKGGAEDARPRASSRQCMAAHQYALWCVSEEGVLAHRAEAVCRPCKVCCPSEVTLTKRVGWVLFLQAQTVCRHNSSRASLCTLFRMHFSGTGYTCLLMLWRSMMWCLACSAGPWPMARYCCGSTTAGSLSAGRHLQHAPSTHAAVYSPAHMFCLAGLPCCLFHSCPPLFPCRGELRSLQA